MAPTSRGVDAEEALANAELVPDAGQACIPWHVNRWSASNVQLIPRLPVAVSRQGFKMVALEGTFPAASWLW